MGILKDEGVDYVSHYTPLHYLPFIARDQALLSKPSLCSRGFGKTHLRSKSSVHDVARGFGRYAFLTIEQRPRITRAKLRAGFPHVGITIPAEAVEATTFDLCRYNVAMTRQLRRNGASGWPESTSNGRYYGSHQIPVARTATEKTALLQAHLNKNMIEVLVHGDVKLPDSTYVTTYSDADQKIAAHILASVECPWTVRLAPVSDRYTARKQYADQVDEFIKKALSDPLWRGNGLEFDRV